MQRHHEKNRKPRLPDPDSLKLLNQETESSVQPSRAKRSKASGSGPTPDQLSWYGPRWKRFLEDAKAECRLQHALENPFPALVKNLPGSITEVLIATLVMWDRNGEQFEAGECSFVLVRSQTNLSSQGFGLSKKLICLGWCVFNSFWADISLTVCTEAVRRSFNLAIRLEENCHKHCTTIIFAHSPAFGPRSRTCCLD